MNFLQNRKITCCQCQECELECSIFYLFLYFFTSLRLLEKKMRAMILVSDINYRASMFWYCSVFAVPVGIFISLRLQAGLILGLCPEHVNPTHCAVPEGLWISAGTASPNTPDYMRKFSERKKKKKKLMLCEDKSIWLQILLQRLWKTVSSIFWAGTPAFLSKQAELVSCS